MEGRSQVGGALLENTDKHGEADEILVRMLGHLCTALVHREAVFGLQFWNDFEHVGSAG